MQGLLIISDTIRRHIYNNIMGLREATKKGPTGTKLEGGGGYVVAVVARPRVEELFLRLPIREAYSGGSSRLMGANTPPQVLSFNYFTFL